MCGKPATSMCSGCGSAIKYCSTECQKRDWPSHQQSCKSTTAANVTQGQAISPSDQRANQTEDARPDMNDPEELKYYMQQIYLIVKPVVCCIILSVIWVKISLMGSDYRPVRSDLTTVYRENSQDSASARFAGSLTNALIILSQVVVATIILVLLIKYNCYKVKFMSSLKCITIFSTLGPIRLYFPCCGSDFTSHELRTYIEFGASSRHTSRLYHNVLCPLELGHRRERRDFLAWPIVGSTSISCTHEFADGICPKWIGAVDRVAAFRYFSNLGFDCSALPIWSSQIAD